jgi:hypothetical protein
MHTGGWLPCVQATNPGQQKHGVEPKPATASALQCSRCGAGRCAWTAARWEAGQHGELSAEAVPPLQQLQPYPAARPTPLTWWFIPLCDGFMLHHKATQQLACGSRHCSSRGGRCGTCRPGRPGWQNTPHTRTQHPLPNVGRDDRPQLTHDRTQHRHWACLCWQEP